jgi:hypothetical protein
MLSCVLLFFASSFVDSVIAQLLVIVERGIDLAAMMHHPWTYSAMVHDVLGLRVWKEECESILCSLTCKQQQRG